MDIGIISARYARALFAYAKEQQTESRLYDDLKMLATSFEQVKELREALDNPVLSAQEKGTLIRSAAGGSVCPAFERFLRLVLRHRRESLLHILCLIYISYYRKEKHINRIQVYTAVPLTAESRERLTRDILRMTGGTLEFSEQVDPSLIGGIILRMNDRQIDASVASQLKRVKHFLMDKEQTN